MLWVHICAGSLCFYVNVCGHDSCFGVCIGKGSAVAVCGSHRWVGYAEWAQRGWLSYKPYQPIASLLTIRP